MWSIGEWTFLNPNTFQFTASVEFGVVTSDSSSIWSTGVYENDRFNSLNCMAKRVSWLLAGIFHAILIAESLIQKVENSRKYSWK